MYTYKQVCTNTHVHTYKPTKLSLIDYIILQWTKDQVDPDSPSTPESLCHTPVPGSLADKPVSVICKN